MRLFYRTPLEADLDLTLSGFALGLLFGAAKVLLIGTIGFGIAWWRSRKRLHALEMEQARPSLTEERLERLEQGFEYLASQLDRVLEGQVELTRQLTAREVPRPALLSDPATRSSPPDPVKPSPASSG